MPIYQVTHPDGRQLEIEGDRPPTEGELIRIFGTLGSQKTDSTPTEAIPEAPQARVPKWGERNPNLYATAGAAREALGPVLETLGIAGGGVVGAAATPELFGAGALPGAGLGYAAAKRLTGAVDVALGNKPATTLPQEAKDTASDVMTGAAMEAGGRVAPKVISSAARGIGKVGSQILGTTTGAGQSAIEGAVKGGKDFTDAMRGNITPEEVVSNAKNALYKIKDARAAAYQNDLQAFEKKVGIIDTVPVKDKLVSMLKSYRAKFDPTTNEWDLSKSVFDRRAQGDVKAIIDKVSNWTDDTPLGMDTLKRQLDDFYSDSNNARAFVTGLRNTVKDSIVRQVPQYAKMTSKYAEASNLIRDVEKGLMMGKGQQADQTLRRLNSAMRENFEMRLDLVKALSDKSGQDVQGQVAGYAMSPFVPRGLFGKVAAGSEAFFIHNLAPQYLPLLASSSPRTVGEFLKYYGIGLRQLQAMNNATGFTSIAPRTLSQKIMNEGGNNNVPTR